LLGLIQRKFDEELAEFQQAIASAPPAQQAELGIIFVMINRWYNLIQLVFTGTNQ